MAERAVKRRSENTKCSCVEKLAFLLQTRARLPNMGASRKVTTSIVTIKYAGMAELADALDSGTNAREALSDLCCFLRRIA